MDEKSSLPTWLEEMGMGTFTFWVAVVATIVLAVINYQSHFAETTDLEGGLRGAVFLWFTFGVSLWFQLFIALTWLNAEEGCMREGLGSVQFLVVGGIGYLVMKSPGLWDAISQMTFVLTVSSLIMIFPVVMILPLFIAALASSAGSKPDGVIIFFRK